MFEEQLERFRYRRQYLLAPRPIEKPGNWRQIELSNNSFLTAHQDLPVTVAHCGNRSMYLLGFIIDACNPSRNDSEIVQDVVDRSKTADDVFFNIGDKCGRFVIILRVGSELRIFSDTCGLRQVFYHVDNNDLVWCSSQPHLIAEQRSIEINEGVRADLNRTSLFRTTDHWYPNSITLFDNIFHLTPNHYFDFTRKTVSRYWPRGRLTPISIAECIPEVSRLLGGIVEGAAQRFNLAFAISCGLDSRTLLAASRKSARKSAVFYPRRKGSNR